VTNDLHAFLRRGFTVGPDGALNPPKEEPLGKDKVLPSKSPVPSAGGQGNTLILPYPPSVNRYLGYNRQTGRRYLRPDGKAYITEVKRIGVSCIPLLGDVCFTMWLYRPLKAGDLLNRDKVLCDALEGILYKNDKQIAEAHLYRFDDPENPRVEVEVRPNPS
jgi:crossover junction endodeoxyribonuclease RusA